MEEFIPEDQDVFPPSNDRTNSGWTLRYWNLICYCINRVRRANGSEEQQPYQHDCSASSHVDKTTEVGFRTVGSGDAVVVVCSSWGMQVWGTRTEDRWTSWGGFVVQPS